MSKTLSIFQFPRTYGPTLCERVPVDTVINKVIFFFFIIRLYYFDIIHVKPNRDFNILNIKDDTNSTRRDSILLDSLHLHRNFNIARIKDDIKQYSRQHFTKQIF